MEKYIDTEVEVLVDLSHWSSEELHTELEERGDFYVGTDLLQKIYDLRCQGKPFEHELEQLFWQRLGRM